MSAGTNRDVFGGHICNTNAFYSSPNPFRKNAAYSGPWKRRPDLTCIQRPISITTHSSPDRTVREVDLGFGYLPQSQLLGA
jgi:hypothetical protein